MIDKLTVVHGRAQDFSQSVPQHLSVVHRLGIRQPYICYDDSKVHLFQQISKYICNAIVSKTQISLATNLSLLPFHILQTNYKTVINTYTNATQIHRPYPTT